MKSVRHLLHNDTAQHFVFWLQVLSNDLGQNKPQTINCSSSVILTRKI